MFYLFFLLVFSFSFDFFVFMCLRVFFWVYGLGFFCLLLFSLLFGVWDSCSIRSCAGFFGGVAVCLGVCFCE